MRLSTILSKKRFAVKMLYFLYLNKFENNTQLLDEMQKEIEWNLKMKKDLGSQSEVLALKECILKYNRTS